MKKPDHADVSRRAYELFLSRGGQHGLELQDWLEAERQLMAATKRAPKKPAASARGQARR